MCAVGSLAFLVAPRFLIAFALMLSSAAVILGIVAIARGAGRGMGIAGVCIGGLMSLLYLLV